MLEKALDLVHLDFAPQHRQPSGWRLAGATIASLAGSLLADALIVVIAQALVPSTKGYVHFQFGDYAKLTVVGVIIACVAWPITTRITSQPRLMFFMMAIAVTLVLWLPDVYILVKGQPAKAVAFLFLMHLAIALVTYNALVRLAPVRARRQASTHSCAPGQAVA
jgi:bacteriorhodopsin